MGEKGHCFAIYISWHGISSKNLEKVEHGAKSNALMVRPGQIRSGQVRSGHAKLSGSENTYTTFSMLYRSTYQISFQWGHRAQSNYCRYTNRLRAFNPPLTGGGGYFLPLSFFRDISESYQRIIAKFSIPSKPSI